MRTTLISSFFFFNDTATTEIYTLSLHDALPIYLHDCEIGERIGADQFCREDPLVAHGDANIHGTFDHVVEGDRKSTRLNSSHLVISYAVFCLKKKMNIIMTVL